MQTYNLIRPPKKKVLENKERKKKSFKKIDTIARCEPGKNSPTVTFVFPSATSLLMCLPIRLNSIFLRALVTFPFFLSMLSAKMFFDASKVSQCSARVVVNTSRFGADIDPLLNLSRCSLSKLPWKIVASPMQLKVLVSLEPFVTYLTHKTVRGH